jgi:hypothetical protein
MDSGRLYYDQVGSCVQEYRDGRQREVFARRGCRWGKKYLEDILAAFFKPLTGLPLSDLPSAYSFCNLELHAIAAYSEWNRGF